MAVVDGKMQDDATYKQARVLLETAELIARKDPGGRGALRPLAPVGRSRGYREAVYGQRPTPAPSAARAAQWRIMARPIPGTR